MELRSKKIVVLVAEEHDTREFWYPFYRLKEAGAEVLIAGKESGKEYPSKNKLMAKADIAWADIDPQEIDGIVIPGGFGPDYMRRSPECVALVREADKAGKLIAFICHAGWLPISADILRGRRATSFPSIRDDMVNAGCEWQDSEVVLDGNLVSSRNPNDLPGFMRAVTGYFASGN
jgi:protease I